MSRGSRIWTLCIVLAAVAGLAVSWRLLPDSAPVDAPEPAAETGPTRVILFAPNLTETAAALGHLDRVIAVTDYCRWPEEALSLPRVGGALDPNFERIAVLRPDLLVLQGESTALRAFAAEQGIAVESVKMDDDIESILEGIEAVDHLFSGPDSQRGRTLADELREEIDAYRVMRTARPKVLLVLGRRPNSVLDLFTTGRGTYLHELLDLAGAENWAASRAEGYWSPSPEALVADPPDLVFEVTAAGAPTDPERLAAPWLRLGLRETEVIALESDGVMIPGPRILETLREMATKVAEARP